MFKLVDTARFELWHETLVLKINCLWSCMGTILFRPLFLRMVGLLHGTESIASGAAWGQLFPEPYFLHTFKLMRENMVFNINCLWSCMGTIIFIFFAAEAQRDTAKSRTNDIHPKRHSLF